MLSLQLTVAAAGRTLLLSSQVAPPPVISAIVPDSANLSLFLDGETFSSTADSRIFTDFSSNNFTVTNVNRNVVQTSFSPYGEVGYWSMQFHGRLGQSDIISRYGNDPTNFNFMHNTTAKFTFECWILRTSAVTGQRLWDETGGSDSRIGVGISITSGKLKLTIGNGSAVFCTANSISDIPYRWTHIAVTYDQSLASGNAKIYIDGVLDSTTDKVAGTPSSANSYQGFQIGQLIKGFISNLRISNDIIYSSNFTPATKPLTASSSTQLLIFQTANLIDNSTNGYRLNGGYPRVSRTSPFGVPQQTTASVGSAYFDSNQNKQLLLPSTPALTLGTGDFTVECWIYPGLQTNGGSVSYDRSIIGADFGAATGTSCMFCLQDNTNKMSIYHKTTSRYNSQSRINSTDSLDSNVWSHIAWVRYNGNMTFFINGKASGTATNYNIDFSYQGQMAIGRDETALSNNPGRKSKCLISDLRVVKGTAVYTSNFTPPVNPLEAITGTSLLMKFNNWSISDKINSQLLPFLVSTSTTATGVVTSVKKNGTSSLYFNGGTNDFIRIPQCYDTPNYTLDFGRADFTVEFWINYQSFASGKIIFTHDSSSASGNQLLIVSTASGITVSMTSNGSSFDIANGVALFSGVATTSTWYHLALTRNNDTFRTFVNGTTLRTFTSTATLNAMSSQDLTIGGRGGATNINGYIDDFRVYQGFAKYTADFTPE